MPGVCHPRRGREQGGVDGPCLEHVSQWSRVDEKLLAFHGRTIGIIKLKNAGIELGSVSCRYELSCACYHPSSLEDADSLERGTASGRRRPVQ
jgi:hypothetical protein